MKLWMTLTYLLVGISWGLVAQNIQADTLAPAVTDTDSIYEIVEEMPLFPGCEQELTKEAKKNCNTKRLYTFIAEHLKYPELAKENGTEGLVAIRMIVERDGSLSFEDDAIVKDIGDGCGAQALLMLQKMPRWIPGKQDSIPQRVYFTIPVKFELEKKEAPKEQTVRIKWGDTYYEGSYLSSDPAKYVTATISLAEAESQLSQKREGWPVLIEMPEGKSPGFSQYFIALGKDDKKRLVEHESKNKPIRKKILKRLEAGKTIYFYNWEYKKGFLEIRIE